MKILKKLFSKSFFSGVRGKAPHLRFKQTAPRRLFGRSKISPSGEIFAPSLSLARFAGERFSIEFSPSCGHKQVILRPYRVFADIHVILYLQIGTSLPPSLRKPEGGVQSARTSLLSFLNPVSDATLRVDDIQPAADDIQRFALMIYAASPR